MNTGREIVVATRNEKKFYELKRYLKNLDVKIVSLKDFADAPKVTENGKTFKENAAKKALVTSKFIKGLVLADDSGLVVKRLDGHPGVKSSRFAGSRKSDKANNRKVLRLLDGVPLNKRQAKFVCAVAIAHNGHLVKMIEEECKGFIAFEEKGRYEFGYDTLFLYPKYKKTFGELGLKVKDKFSHRSKAMKKAREFLRKYL